MRGRSKLNGQDKRKLSLYLFFILHVYEEICRVVGVCSHHVSMRQLSLRVKPMSSTAEMTHKKPQKAKNKKNILGDIVNSLDGTLLKLRNSFYCLRKPFGVGFSNTCS